VGLDPQEAIPQRQKKPEVEAGLGTRLFRLMLQEVAQHPGNDLPAVP